MRRFILAVAVSLSTLSFACTDAGGTDGAQPGGGGDGTGAATPPGGDPPAPGVEPMPAYLKQPASSPYIEQVTWGSPYDSVIDAPLVAGGSAIAPGLVPTDGLGQLVTDLEIRRIDTDEDLFSSLEVTAEVDVNGGAFGASAKTKFAREHHLNRSSLYLFVHVKAEGRTQKIDGATLTDEAKALSPEAFYKRFGDRYVSSIVLGQEVFGIVEIQTQSVEDKESLSVEMGLKYGASSGSAKVSSVLSTMSSSIHTNVYAKGLGVTPPVYTTPVEFLTDAQHKFDALSAGTVDPGAQTLRYNYTTYYGLAGYPGVPKGIDANVLQHRQAVSDFRLYKSLLADFTDAGYPSDLPVFAPMTAFATAMQGFLETSITTTPALPTVPAIDPAKGIESFAKINASPSTSPGAYNVHLFANGFLPRHLADYGIPVRHAVSGAIHGVAFDPVVSIKPAISLATPPAFELYPVDRSSVGQGLCLAYRWEGSGPTYFFDGVTTGAALDLTKIPGALAAQHYTNMENTGVTAYKNFFLVNAASGLVMNQATDGSGVISQKPVGAGELQLWNDFTSLITFIPGLFPDNAPGAIWLSSASSTVLDLAGGGSAPGTTYQSWSVNGYNDSSNQRYVIASAGNGFVTIKNVAGGTLVSASPTCAPGASSCDTPWLASGQRLVGEPFQINPSGPTVYAGANSLWRIVPRELVESAL